MSWKNWSSFKTKFQTPWIDWKYSYQVRQVLAPFSNLIALMLGYNSVNNLRVTKIVKKITLERVWDESDSKNVSVGSHSQSIGDPP